MYSLLLGEVCPGVNHPLVRCKQKTATIVCLHPQLLHSQPVNTAQCISLSLFIAPLSVFHSWSKIGFIYLFIYVYLKKFFKRNYGNLYWHCEWNLFISVIYMKILKWLVAQKNYGYFSRTVIIKLMMIIKEYIKKRAWQYFLLYLPMCIVKWVVEIEQKWLFGTLARFTQK